MANQQVKAAFVTGGSRGIGRGIIERLAKDGYDVAFTYNTKLDEAQILHDVVTSLGRRCFYYKASMEKDGVADEVTRAAIRDLGELSVMVCCAGLTVHSNLARLSAGDIDFAYNLDYRSYMLCAKEAAQHMIDREIAGNIILITSTRGIRAYPEDPLYGGMKAALNRATESMALELAPYGIRVNALAPGATAVRGGYSPEELRSKPFARFIPLQRLGSPAECAALVAYLISDEAAYMTGTTLRLDGGLILPGIPADASGEEEPKWHALPRHLK